MQKILFFDNWGLEIVDGLKRQLGRPVKHAGNPLFIADEVWEEGNMQTYGSVIKLPGRPFQLWYSITHHKPQNICLAYAESEDGLVWHKPRLDRVKYKGRKTNIVMDADVHGPAVVHDPVGKVYRLIAGTSPSQCVSVYVSKDGLEWSPMNQGPVVANKPDCSIGLVRTRKGHYAAYHRHPSMGRRICRTTSADFRFWNNEPHLVLEPDPLDPPQLQFYAMGTAMYGSYELGTLWTYHTLADDLSTWHMRGQQQAELTYSRNGWCWHRAAQGQPFIAHGQGKAWDRGNLQCTSQPVYLDDEIRYYYTGTDCSHDTNWELAPHTAGLGIATLRPDGFVSLDSQSRESSLLTTAFGLGGPVIRVNAKVARQGSLRLAVLDEHGKAIPGYALADCQPVTGDSTAHQLSWNKHPNATSLVGQRVRLSLASTHARLFSISIQQLDEQSPYHTFTSPF